MIRPGDSTLTLAVRFLVLYLLLNELPAPSRGGVPDRDSGGENRPSPERARLACSDEVKWCGKRISLEGEGGFEGGGVMVDGEIADTTIVGVV